MSRIVVAVAVLGWLVVSRSLGEVEYRLVEVADSGSYFVYSYVLKNPPSSTWGLSAAIMDISASSGTPATLPATGPFEDLVAAFGGATPHAEVGPISPAGWRAIMNTQSGLRWSPPGSVTTTSDSITPGDSLGGFGLRSSYLPGLRRMQYEPTVESCCQQPIATDPEIFWALPRNYTVEGWSVGPRYMPEEVDLELLQIQLTTICSDPLWLDNSGLCTEFDGLLDEASADYDDLDYYAAAFVLDHLLDRVNEEQSQFDANGYWLLRLNVQQAYDNVWAEAQAENLLFYFTTTLDTIIAPDARVMSLTPQSSGAVEGAVAASSSETFYWVRELDQAWTIPTGPWGLQLDFFEIELGGGDLSLHDVQVHRYDSSGILEASMYLHQGQVLSLPTGQTRVSLAENLTSWGAHDAGDLLAVSFVLQNNHVSQSAGYSIRANPVFSDWGGSWLAHPY